MNDIQKELEQLKVDREVDEHNENHEFRLGYVKAMCHVINLVKNLDIPRVINWVAITERLPEEEWGDYMVCLKNNAIFKANYSRIGTERWLIVGMGDIKETNPVKYWAELPEPPCL